MGNDGNLYGVTSGGGQYGYGTVFQLVPSGAGWTENVIYSFQHQNDGYDPTSLVQDSSGNLFGIAILSQTLYGPQGTLFMLSPADGKWVFTTVASTGGHTFASYHSLALDAAGNLYETGSGADGDCMGTKDIFAWVVKGVRTSNGWQWSGLPQFWDEHFDAYSLALDAQGNLFGTTYNCGKYGNGTVWQISP